MKRIISIVASLGLVALMLSATAGTALAITPPTSEPTPKYVVAAWNMPTFTNDHTYHWPQTLAFYTTSDTINLNALNHKLRCEKPYQIDVYYNNETTTALLEGGYLTGPGDPTEALVPGGYGVAYIARFGPECEDPTPPPPTTPPTTPPTEPPVTPPPSAEPSLPPVVTPAPSEEPTLPPVVTITPPPTSTVSNPVNGAPSSLPLVLAFLGLLSFGALALSKRFK